MSSFLTRRTLRRRSDALQSLITFPLEQEWFALPIQVVQRVIPIEQVYGSSVDGSLCLTRYHNQEIVVLDIRSRIFSRLAPAPSVQSEDAAQPHLLILDHIEGELLGIRLDKPPVLRRVPQSAFAPVPPTYLLESGMRCVSALVKPPEPEPLLFFLNLEQVLQTRSLPASLSS